MARYFSNTFRIGCVLLLAGCSMPGPAPVKKKQEPQVIVVIEREISVNDRVATVFGILEPGGTFGLKVLKGSEFNYPVYNATRYPTSLHWHGLILPSSQDGTACITQLPIAPGATYPYQFKLTQSGTFWMHSHFGLQLQQQLAAPLILIDPAEKEAKYRDVVAMFTDFSFESPQAIFDGLKQMSDHASGAPDINDVVYDAYLTNNRTLSDPEIVKVKPGEIIRLRLIDGASTTNFFVDLGKLNGQAIAVDGNRIRPFNGSKFEIAGAQRLDLVVSIPRAEGAYPILAQAEGTAMQTGLILMTPEAEASKISSQAANRAGAFTYSQERRLRAASDLAVRPVDRTIVVNLEGSMSPYVWKINGQVWPNAKAIKVKKNQRIEMVFNNQTDMAHPMHLHGHVFQIKEIDGQPMTGAMRDTILVLPRSTVKIQFDTNNPGVWALHCHHLYHMHAGMMTTLLYDGYIAPDLNRETCQTCGCIQ